MLARSLGSLFLVAAALGALAAPAQAQQKKPDYAEARKLYFGAKDAMGKGEYDEAVRQFLLAYDITKDPTLFKQIATAYEESGRKPEAIVYYRRYLDEAKDAGDADEVRAHLAALEGTGAPASQPAPAPASEPAAAPPTSAPAHEPPQLPPPEPPQAEPPPSPELAPPPAPTLYEEHGGSWQRAAAWVSVGFAAVFVTTASVLATSAVSRHDDLQRLIDFRDPVTGEPKIYSGSTKDDYESKKREGERLSRFGTYAFIGAGACAGAAVLFFILDATRGVETPEAHAHIRPSFSPSGIGVVAGWEL